MECKSAARTFVDVVGVRARGGWRGWDGALCGWAGLGCGWQGDGETSTRDLGMMTTAIYLNLMLRLIKYKAILALGVYIFAMVARLRSRDCLAIPSPFPCLSPELLLAHLSYPFFLHALYLCLCQVRRQSCHARTPVLTDHDMASPGTPCILANHTGISVELVVFVSVIPLNKAFEG